MTDRLKFRIFAHSWTSDWNHGNAHFLRGLASQLGQSGGVLALGGAFRRLYVDRSGLGRAWTCREAAEVVHYVCAHGSNITDVRWVGKGGGEEGTGGLQECLSIPVSG